MLIFQINGLREPSLYREGSPAVYSGQMRLLALEGVCTFKTLRPDNYSGKKVMRPGRKKQVREPSSDSPVFS